jgi:hypothetical protein
MAGIHTPALNTRLGFHYFPDTLHYREDDLRTWLPELRAMGATWLSLQAPRDRAIPERFIMGLLEAGIEPVLHFNLPFEPALPANQQEMLLAAYARWGVHYAVLFDRPNRRSAWPASAWAKDELVERFLDRYIPLAVTASSHGLIPVFPPLEPGGDYWDTAFLRGALAGLKRRSPPELIDDLVLSAYARVDGKPLDWGRGGPESWPGTRPYATPASSQDQRGFRIFDWYLAIAQAVLGSNRPMLLFGIDAFDNSQDEVAQVKQAQQIAHSLLSLQSEPAAHGGEASLDLIVPAEVLAGHLSLLSCQADDPQAKRAWFRAGGGFHPAVIAMRHQAAGMKKLSSGQDTPALGRRAHPITHYLLLPSYDWGISDWHLTAVRPFLKKYRPTLGFSLEDALLAERVTVVGNEHDFPENALNALRASGCLVERIGGDGTSIASFLAE